MPARLAGLSDVHLATTAGDATRDCAGRFTASGEFHPALKQRLHRSIAGVHMATPFAFGSGGRSFQKVHNVR